MSRHDAFVLLAAAAVDNPLAPSDRARLAGHLADCPACSRVAAGMRADARELETLPVLRMPTGQANLVFATLRGPVRARVPVRLLLAVALLGLLLVGAALAAGSGWIRLPWREPAIPAIVTPTPGHASPSADLGSFAPTGPLPNGFQAEFAALLPDGRVVMGGGCHGSVLIYDPPTGHFTETEGLAGERLGASAALLADGRVLFAGGTDCSGATVLATAELFDPVTGSSTPTGELTEPRMGASATVLADGRVLIAGGASRKATPYLADLSAAELYDPRSGTFTATGPMTAPSTAHTATLLGDGTVLIAGGSRSADVLTVYRSAQRYDPATGTFTATGPLAEARWGHTATLLRDGRVLIAGGRMNRTETLATAEVFDPATGHFTSGGIMAESRAGAAATLLVDGRVLVVGGSGDNAFRSSAEFFDPGAGVFSSAASMDEGRAPGNATLLADGRVLIAGGVGGTATDKLILTSALLYTPRAETSWRAGRTSLSGPSWGWRTGSSERTGVPRRAAVQAALVRPGTG